MFMFERMTVNQKDIQKKKKKKSRIFSQSKVIFYRSHIQVHMNVRTGTKGFCTLMNRSIGRST